MAPSMRPTSIMSTPVRSMGVRWERWEVRGGSVHFSPPTSHLPLPLFRSRVRQHVILGAQELARHLQDVVAGDGLYQPGVAPVIIEPQLIQLQRADGAGHALVRLQAQRQPANEAGLVVGQLL